MKSFFDIVETIKDVVSSEFPNKKVFDKDVADLLDISQMNFATMKKRNKIPFNELLDFCAKRSIAINWLLYNQSPESLIEPTNRFYRVPYFSSVNASAGGGACNDELEFHPLLLAETFACSLGGEKELRHIEAINVSGDSMEPSFGNNDIVFLNRSKLDVERGGIFTIQTEYGLFIKRLQMRIDGSIDIISDNKEYPTSVVGRNEIEIVGRVVGRFGSVE
jgi:hypothetical protein